MSAQSRRPCVAIGAGTRIAAGASRFPLLTLSLAVALAGCQRSHDEPAGGGAGSPPGPVDAAPVAAPVETVPAPTTAVGPSSPYDDAPEGALRAYVWACADGQKIVMRNLFRERAIAIDLHDGTRRLEQTVSASGARYEDAVTVFWTRGSTATFERKGAPPVRCNEVREESLREDARLRAAG